LTPTPTPCTIPVRLRQPEELTGSARHPPCPRTGHRRRQHPV